MHYDEKMEAMERLAGCMAHDFNNILTSILGYSELILNTVDEDNPMREDINEIREAGKRAASITQQLLIFSSKQELLREEVNLTTAINSMARKLQSLAGKKIMLSIEADPHVDTIFADRKQIEQVIMNFAINACDAMIDGGNLIINIKNETIPSYSPEKFVCIMVEDNGIGMTDGTIARIFEPFFSTSKKKNRSGLGLSTAYGIIKKHKGWIEVQSKPDNGSTFKVYLPALSR
ncbi:MAG: two-component system sensor histidine kinase NtrB [bacterium]